MTDDSACVADEVESNPNSHTYITIFIVLTIKKKKKNLRSAGHKLGLVHVKKKRGVGRAGELCKSQTFFFLVSSRGRTKC